ncbi:MAG: hypothetical protein U9O78_03890 [Patescibacteria group bacterium]|nr:hypothetical protein [Patescibacteria group bacterium]
MKINKLRNKHSNFIYEHFDYHFDNSSVFIEFHFKIRPDIEFHPKLTIHGVDKKKWDCFPKNYKNVLIFHLGLAEIPSYWKATCSPEINIQPYKLSFTQQNWWKELLIKGLGEFYYKNEIDFTPEEFVCFTFNSRAEDLPQLENRDQYQNKYLLPLGGGKDSSLLIRILEENEKQSGCLLLKPLSPAAEKVAAAFQCQQLIKIERKIDPQLIKLNQKGYLNGHTPFSAYLAFTSTLIAHLFGYQQVLVGNESSANQPNLKYLGQEINHQYSKSFEFEQSFREYAKHFLGMKQTKKTDPSKQPQAEYLSALRPLSELKIAQLFSQFPQYHSIFRSCNVGQKKNNWCHQCPKCLFVFALLYPFIDEQKLTTEIFDHNLFEDDKLTETALELTGNKKQKPFECVGTYEESQAAFYLSVKKYLDQGKQLPVVLQKINKEVIKYKEPQDWEKQVETILNTWDANNFLNEELTTIIKKQL